MLFAVLCRIRNEHVKKSGGNLEESPENDVGVVWRHTTSREDDHNYRNEGGGNRNGGKRRREGTRRRWMDNMREVLREGIFGGMYIARVQAYMRVYDNAESVTSHY